MLFLGSHASPQGAAGRCLEIRGLGEPGLVAIRPDDLLPRPKSTLNKHCVLLHPAQLSHDPYGHRKGKGKYLVAWEAQP